MILGVDMANGHVWVGSIELRAKKHAILNWLKMGQLNRAVVGSSQPIFFTSKKKKKKGQIFRENESNQSLHLIG